MPLNLIRLCTTCNSAKSRKLHSTCSKCASAEKKNEERMVLRIKRKSEQELERYDLLKAQRLEIIKTMGEYNNRVKKMENEAITFEKK